MAVIHQSEPNIKKDLIDVNFNNVEHQTNYANNIVLKSLKSNKNMGIVTDNTNDLHRSLKNDSKVVNEAYTSKKETKVMKIIFLGAPGAGKGTQAEVVGEHCSIPTISTGNIIRQALNSGTDLGKKAQSFMDKGVLVPDEVVIDIVKERISKKDCEKGFILDGFPRTIPQAEALDKMGVTIDKVVYIHVADESIVNRMSGRRVCKDCGSSYNLEHKKPNEDGYCDLCAGTLIQRKDDHPDTVKERLTVYHNETEPLKKYYEKQNKLIVIDGQDQVSKVTNQILDSLGV